MNAQDVQARLLSLGNPEIARISQRFFKTGPGEYGEGDIFAGIRVPLLRKLAGEYRELAFPEVIRLLRSPVHEARLLALFILMRLYAQSSQSQQKHIYSLYLQNTRYINNWDLVDASAEHIVGAYLCDRNKKPLNALAKSCLLWDRRISIMATFHYIKRGEFAETLRIASLLLSDQEDLIHKAVGWMLREVGKRNFAIEDSFLRMHYQKMPRTMLRYAIEKFPGTSRKAYLRGRM